MIPGTKSSLYNYIAILYVYNYIDDFFEFSDKLSGPGKMVLL